MTWNYSQENTDALIRERDELRRRVSQLERHAGEYRATMNTYWGMSPRWTQVPPLLVKLQDFLKRILNQTGEHLIYCPGELPSPNTGCIDNRCDEARVLLESLDFGGDPLELVADQVHRQWSGWTRHVLSKLEESHDAHWLPEEWIERWQRQIDTPYSGLSEEERESDRREARKILEALEIR